jgi:hypothetical protein
VPQHGHGLACATYSVMFARAANTHKAVTLAEQLQVIDLSSLADHPLMHHIELGIIPYLKLGSFRPIRRDSRAAGDRS